MQNISAFSQWKPISDFNIFSNEAIIDEANYIWCGGNFGKLARYNYLNSEIEYIILNDSVDFHALHSLNDTILVLGGRVWKDFTGFILLYNTIHETVESTVSFPYTIWDIEFISPDTGFISSFSGIHRTIDRGESWDLSFDFPSIGAEYGEVFSIISDSTGQLFASGQKKANMEQSYFQGFVAKSDDRGRTWNVIFEIDDGIITNLDIRHNILYCHDRSLLSYYFSSDYGESWNIRDIPIENPWLRIRDIEFIGSVEVNAIIAQDYFPESQTLNQSNNMILNSPNDGSTWYIQYQHLSSLPTMDSSLTSFININDTLIYSFGWGYALFTENQGGENNPIMSLSNIFIPGNVSVFPNPANEFVIVNSDQYIDKYTIHSAQGVLIQKGILNGEKKIRIALESMEPGAYIISLYNKNTASSQLLMKH
jgi:hypothetical protein